MKDVSFKRKYIVTMIVCIIFVMIVGSHEGCCPDQNCDMCPLDSSSWAGLHTTYHGSTLPYPDDINVSFTPENSSGTSASRRDIAVDASGRVHAVWIETENRVRNVYYACSVPTGSWEKTNVSQFHMEDKKFQARTAALAVTPRGVPHIAWEVEFDNNGTPLTLEENDNHYVYYVYGSSGCPQQTGWRTCAGTIYSPPSPSHTPGLNNYNDANVSRNDSNSYHYDAWSPALALDNKGRPHITWNNEIPYHAIFWVYCDGCKWKTCDGAVYHFEGNSNCNAIVSESNSSHYMGPSIAIDSGNGVHIAYHSYPLSASKIYYVGISSVSTGYDCQQPIGTGNSGKHASIAVDSDDLPWIVWEDGAIKYSSKLSSGSWSSPVTISGTQGCLVPCFALDRDDKSHIVFYCSANNNKEIFYSYNLASPINVSNNSDNSFSPSIALDNDCNPHLLWTDETPPEAEREVLYVHLRCKK